MPALSTRSASASTSSSASSSSSSDQSSSSASVPISPINDQPIPVEQSSEEEDEGTAEVECPSFVRDRTITRTLHDFETEDDGVPEPDFSWDAKTISHHLARYLDDLCGWVPDAKVQYRRVAAPQGKNGPRTRSKSDLEAQVKRLSINSRMASRMKAMTMEFEFRHYHNPKKYMEQYRRFHTCGGPLEKLAAHDTSYGRKRSIYYAGDASAEAGFRVELEQPKQDARLTTAQLQPATSGERSDGQRPTKSRQRQNSESKSERSRTDTASESSGSTLPPAMSSQNTGVQNEHTSLPRYCTLTEAANRKRQVYSHWMGVPTSRGSGHSSAPRSTRDGEHIMSSNLPTKLTVVDDAATQHLPKPQSCTPTGTSSTAVGPNNGFRQTFHNPLVSSPTAVANADDVVHTALQLGSPPNGPHHLWKANQFPATTDNHTLPVAFGGMAGNFSTGVTLDDSCYGYHNNGVTSSEGSAFRDFYSHLLQAAHYLRLAGRQKSMDNSANKQPPGPRHHTGPALYKSPKITNVTSPTNENVAPIYADHQTHSGLPSNVALAHGLGVRGQRLNSATNQRSSHSANPSLGGGTGTRQFVNPPAFKGSQPRFNSSPAKMNRQDSDAESTFSRKRFISLEPPASSTFRESTTRTAQDCGHRDEHKNKAGKMFHISIPHKPCKAEAAQINKAAVCQAVCFKSESQEALALANGNASKK